MDNLQIYLKSIRAYDELKDDATEQLILKGKDTQAIHGNLHRAVVIAMDMSRKWPEYDVMDFIQEANMALMDSVEAWEENKDIRFSTYFSVSARNRITKFIKENVGAVRMYTTKDQRIAMNNLAEIHSMIDAGKDLFSVASHFDIDVSCVERVVNLNNPGDLNTIPIESPEDEMIRNECCLELAFKIQEFRRTLDDRQVFIFDNVIYDATMKGTEAATALGITKQAVAQAKERILNKASKYFTKEDLQNVL